MDYRELFAQVESFLAERNYAWIVQQVREELATGKLKEERLSTLAETKTGQLSLVDEGSFKKGQPGEFVRRAEYTDKEAVVLLLEAARRAICEVTITAGELTGFLAQNDLTAVVFESDRGEGARRFNVSADAAVQPSIASECAVKIDELVRQILAN